MTSRYRFFHSPPRPILSAATLFYLALPLAMWLLFWLRLPLALLSGIGLGWALWMAIRALPPGTSGEEFPQFLRQALRTYAPIGFFTLFCGAGGFGFIAVDWLNKHNIMLADLMRNPWPVSYPSENGAPLHLVYSLAYYLPSAAIGKGLGWTAANVALQIWTQLGMFLIAAWIGLHLGARTSRAAMWAGWLFLLFSGADQLGHYGRMGLDHLQSGTPWQWNWVSDDFWWIKSQQYYVLYRANVIQLFWAPQHFLAGSLGAALLLRPRPESMGTSGLPGQDALVIALLPLWSPFAALGCVPIVMWNLARDRQAQKRPPWSLLGIAALLCAILILYFTARLPFTPGPGGRATALTTALTTAQGLPRGVHLEFLPLLLQRDIGWLAMPAYLLFDVIEYALLVGFSSALVPPSPWRGYARLAALVLFFLKFFQYGLYNDLMTRAAIPSLFIVFLLVAFALTSTPIRAWKWRHFALVCCLFWGSGHFYRASLRVGSHLKRTLRAAQKGDFTRFVSVENLDEIPNIYQEYRRDPRRQLLTQYVGDDTSFFARFLLRK